MHSSIEIEKKDNGYSVDVMSQRDDEYDVKELVFQDPLDVLAEVLRWLGYGEDETLAVIDVLAEDVVYELTDKGRETLAQLERERLERERAAEQDWKQADRDWEVQRHKAELAVLKRGPGRGGYWTGTPTEQLGG